MSKRRGNNIRNGNPEWDVDVCGNFQVSNALSDDIKMYISEFTSNRERQAITSTNRSLRNLLGIQVTIAVHRTDLCFTEIHRRWSAEHIKAIWFDVPGHSNILDRVSVFPGWCSLQRLRNIVVDVKDAPPNLDDEDPNNDPLTPNEWAGLWLHIQNAPMLENLLITVPEHVLFEDGYVRAIPVLERALASATRLRRVRLDDVSAAAVRAIGTSPASVRGLEYLYLSFTYATAAELGSNVDGLNAALRATHLRITLEISDNDRDDTVALRRFWEAVLGAPTVKNLYVGLSRIYGPFPNLNETDRLPEPMADRTVWLYDVNAELVDHLWFLCRGVRALRLHMCLETHIDNPIAAFAWLGSMRSRHRCPGDVRLDVFITDSVPKDSIMAIIHALSVRTDANFPIVVYVYDTLFVPEIMATIGTATPRTGNFSLDVRWYRNRMEDNQWGTFHLDYKLFL